MRSTSILSLLITAFISISVPANAQSLEQYKNIYHASLKYNDLTTATTAVYGILMVAPDQTNWKDTLAYLYYNDSKFVQALLVGTEILEKNDTMQNIQEIVAISQQNLGLVKESLESYEKLFKMSKSIFHLYKIATLQYALKRYGECGASIQQILDAKDNTQEITITDNNRKQQNVPIKAAILNLSGVIALEVNKPDVAKKDFEEAIKAFPDFELAKANLANVDNKDAAGTAKATKPATTKSAAH